MINFIPNSFVPKTLADRLAIDSVEKHKLEHISQVYQEEIKKIHTIPVIPPVSPLNIFPISQKNSDYSEMSYGLVSTIGDAGCGLLALEYVLRILGFSYDFEDILKECVRKGYRAYIYDADGNIVDGAGTEYSLFNNMATIAYGTYEIIDHLKDGHPITLLINNSIFWQDDNRRGNHFVTLLGIDENSNAIIMDGNLITYESHPQTALIRKDFREVVASIKCAWAWEKSKLMAYLC